MPRGKPSKEKGLDKTLNTVLFCHVEKDNAAHAKKHGKKLFGSYSSYINALIALDRGEPAKLGAWKSPGESKAIREESKLVIQPRPGAPLEKFTPPGPPGTKGYRDPVV